MKLWQDESIVSALKCIRTYAKLTTIEGFSISRRI